LVIATSLCAGIILVEAVIQAVVEEQPLNPGLVALLQMHFYRLSTYAALNFLDDPAMLAFVFC